MEPEGGKQSPHKTPYTQLEEVNSDFTQEMVAEEQDGTLLATLASLESESDSSLENDDGEDEDEDEDGAEFFLSQEFETDLQFLESEGSNFDEEFEDFDIDVDELTYEELILLGDLMGKEKRGLSANEISSCLHSCIARKGEIERCVICQIEYEEGEEEALVALPCEHPYHTDCITKWLQIKKVCPICSNEISVP